MPCLRAYAPSGTWTHGPLIASREHEPLHHSAPKLFNFSQLELLDTEQISYKFVMKIHKTHFTHTERCSDVPQWNVFVQTDQIFFFCWQLPFRNRNFIYVSKICVFHTPAIADCLSSEIPYYLGTIFLTKHCQFFFPYCWDVTNSIFLNR